MYYGTSRNLNIFLTCLNNVNKCGARLVYEQDLEEEQLNWTLKMLKRTVQECGCDEAGPSGGSASFDDSIEPCCKRIKQD
ncbi:TMV resistance protein N [Prunus yedoensis var. nudiflora]|uniref:TMV resistance protein N n=1 Tax=Prunus yedoensis var. nudiflora TaxID=2094558 RepID=A0A314UTR2_PRUYE|nr:TMV resistance protein N [Prunus yedoensis var. nudiflora]